MLSLGLTRLDNSDCKRAVRAIDPSLPDAMGTEIIERGAGTPLLVEELTRLASGPGQRLAIPDIVRATVRKRTRRVAPRAREDRYRFRHPLLQEAAYDEVPAGRRRALH